MMKERKIIGVKQGTEIKCCRTCTNLMSDGKCYDHLMRFGSDTGRTGRDLKNDKLGSECGVWK